MSRTLLQIFPLLIVSLLLSVDATSSVIPNFYWRDYIPGHIPHDALEGAPGRYIGQVYYIGNQVGTIIPESNIISIAFGGRKNFSANVKIFCTRHPNRFYWEYVDFKAPHTTQMKDAVKGGHQTNLGVFDLFIGKVFHNNEWKIGKVVPDGHMQEAFWSWSGAVTMHLFQFEILKYNSTAAENSTDYACSQS